MDSKKHELQAQTVDYVTSAVKAVVGAVPFVGSLFVEVAGTTIPNQRVERIATFAQILENRLTELEHKLVISALSDQNFTDLLEEGLRQASRSLSNERRKYIASLIARSLHTDEIAFAESRHILRILGELNDIEVIWLRFYLMPTLGGDEEFRARHTGLLEPVKAHSGSTQEDRDKAALQMSYKEHLVELGLLERQYEVDSKTGQLAFKSRTGGELKVRSYHITPLGRLLLRQIELSDNQVA